MKKIDKKPFIIVLIASVHVMILIVIVKNLWHTIEIKGEINRLEDKGEDYQLKIEKDSTIIENLQYDDYLEQYAREEYRMQGKDEDVYIIED